MSKVRDRNYRDDYRVNKTIDYNINRDMVSKNPENLKQKQYK